MSRYVYFPTMSPPEIGGCLLVNGLRIQLIKQGVVFSELLLYASG